MDEKIFDKTVGPEKCFYCENGMRFSSIRNFEEALKSCTSDQSKALFKTHATGYKNDFAAWIGNVFELDDLAKRIFFINDPSKLLEELQKYEKEKEGKLENKNNTFDVGSEKQSKKQIEQQKEKQNEKENEKERINQENKIIEQKKIEEKNKEEVKDAQQIVIPESIKKEISATDASLNTQMAKIKSEVDARGDRADHEYDRVKKIKKHSLYNKAEFEDTIEDLKNRYEDLTRVISEHRKAGQDMSIPAMLLKNLYPKIVYFQVSQSKVDFDNVSELMNNLEHEINYAKSVKEKSLKKEIMEALGIKEKKEDE